MAQEHQYELVVQELAKGRKRGHWMWYIFPQIAGLGMSATAKKYEIESLLEAVAYGDHPLLGSRLKECTRLVNDVDDKTAREIFGYPDNLKFRSCMTLFAKATQEGLFTAALDKYYDGRPDELTLNILESQDA